MKTLVFSKSFNDFIAYLGGLKGEGLAHECQDFRIDLIGFCELADAVGKASRLPRVDLCVSDLGLSKAPFQGSVIEASCLKNDQAIRKLAQGLDESLNPARGIGLAAMVLAI